MVHIDCGSDVRGESRKVVAEPADKNWPRDVYVMVPYCPQCKIIVSLGGLRGTQG